VGEGDYGRGLISHVIHALPFAGEKQHQTEKPTRIGVLTDEARAIIEREKAHDDETIPDSPPED
jgi:hypothetical protein